MLSLKPGRPEDVGFCPERMDLIRRRLRSWVAQGRTPAISALVARKGVVVLQEAHGKRTPESADNSLKIDDIFPVMSVCKPFAAAAAMVLVEEGLLSLNRRLRDYVPEVQGDGTDEILIHHLMTWCAGYKEFDLFDYVARNPIKDLPPMESTQDEWSHRFLHERFRAPLSFKPGTENSYGIYGITLLGEVVRRVSGQAFGDFVADRILKPLNMKDSAYVPTPSMKDRVVYRSKELPFGNDEFHFNINTSVARPTAAGGLLSTPMDLAIFAQTFMNGGSYNGTRILSPVTVSEMMRNQIPGVPAMGWGNRMIPEASWGLGWMIQGQEKWPYWTGSLQPVGTVYHQGIGACFLWMDLKHEVIGVYLTVATKVDFQTLEHNWDLDLFQNMVTAAIVDAA